MNDVVVTYKTVAYNPVYALISGDVVSGVYLSQLVEWAEVTKPEDGWICKTQDEWQQRTAMRLNQQLRVRRTLKRLGFISEKIIGWPKQVHVRINMAAIEAAIKRLGE